MDISGIIQILAILIEIAVVVIAALAAYKTKKTYGWFIAITFALFVIFDLVRVACPTVLPDMNSLILLVACISMLYAVWLMYNDQEKNA